MVSGDHETDFSAWLGKQQTRRGHVDARQAHLLAVTLGAAPPQEGQALPMPWHWAWFNDALPADQLGRDGHPKRGGFIPPITLPRRMWAGGDLKILQPVVIGRNITKRSTIESIKEREGRSGKLCIVTLRHELLDGDVLCIDERQNLVYREDPDLNSQTGASSPEPPVPPQGADITRTFTPDPVLMFRYSALTFNGHRIHYDVDYAREVEGYRGLVFHAPLTATLLFALAGEGLGHQPEKFSYRATSPLFCNEPIKLSGKREGEHLTVWAENREGHLAMLCEAS